MEQLAVFFIVLLLAFLAIASAVLYIIYTILKKNFFANKISDKTNKIVKWAFVLAPLVGVISVIFYVYLETNISIKERIYKANDIELPTEYTVLRDEYQDMFQDYTIFFDIKLNDKSKTALIKSIEQSKYYNPSLSNRNYVTQKNYVTADSIKAVWYKYTNGYKFSRYGKSSYSIDFNTTSNIFKFTDHYD